MKMEVIAVQNQYQSQFGMLGSSKVRDWTTTLTAPPNAAGIATAATTINSSTTTAANHHPYLQSHSSINSKQIKHSITKSKSSSSNINSSSSSSIKQQRLHAAHAANAAAAAAAPVTITVAAPAAAPLGDHQRYNSNLFFCDDPAVLDTAAVQELSARLLDELRAAKSRHLTCTEVSLPCDLTPRIAAEILRVSAKEPCGLRGCTIYIEFEDEPNNSRRIASLKMDAETVSTFEVYLTLRQDHRGWTALLPQFMKSLARTITISPEFTITKNKLYAAQQQLSRSSSISYSRQQRAPLATPTS